MTDSPFQDEQILCVECRHSFTFTAGEQEYFRERGFVRPRRCAHCRRAKRRAMDVERELGGSV